MTEIYDKSTFNGGVGEVNAILQETNHSSWSKTSMNYKHSQASYAVNSLNKEGNMGLEEKKLYINRLNQAFNGYSDFFILDGKACVSYEIPDVVFEKQKK